MPFDKLKEKLGKAKDELLAPGQYDTQDPGLLEQAGHGTMNVIRALGALQPDPMTLKGLTVKNPDGTSTTSPDINMGFPIMGSIKAVQGAAEAAKDLSLAERIREAAAKSSVKAPETITGGSMYRGSTPVTEYYKKLMQSLRK